MNKPSLNVMNRRVEPPDALDDFPTPPWGGRSLCHVLTHELGYQLGMMECLEPAANRGYLVKGLSTGMSAFASVYASDIYDYGVGYNVQDYLPQQLMTTDNWQRKSFDWVITNPPFNKALEFVQQSFIVARVGCAMLVRTQWIQGEDRYQELFRLFPPNFLLQYAERIVMVKGRCVRQGSRQRDQAGELVLDANGKPRTHTTATPYLWAVWCFDRVIPAPGPGRSTLIWIPPCRAQFEKPGDYE